MGAWASVANAQNNRDLIASNKKVKQAGLANAQNNRDVVVQDNKAEVREVAAEFIVTREEAASGRAFDPRFRAEVLRKLASRTPSDLESMQAESGAGLALLSSFGSSQADLVYTPVTPCRILDTRVVGGPIRPGVNRSFYVTGTSFSSQGGNPSGCGVPFGPATAAVINLVAVSPNGGGDLRITPYGTAIPLASIINYGTVPSSIANGPAVTICNPATTTCTYDVTIQADTNSTELVADVQGYFSLLPTTLASGQTLTGQYVAIGTATASGQYAATNVSFQFPLSATTAAPNANFIPAGGTSTTSCPGTTANPQAASGNFCVYEAVPHNETLDCLADMTTGSCGQTGVNGAGIFFTSAAAGQFFSYGTWAVTAP
jgi:hypothetical protein